LKRCRALDLTRRRGRADAVTSQPGGATFPDPRTSQPVTVGVAAEKTIGDGVARVRVARSGHVWVGYFDEGVYGNYGWGGGGGGPAPLGAPGLVRFSPDLEPDLARFDHDRRLLVEPVVAPTCI
jgi:hypothetical protein